MKKKLGIGIIAIIIIIGIIMTAIMGLKFDLIYSNNKQVDIYIGKKFENEDVKNIAKEVMGDNQKIIIQKVELYKDMVSIIVKDISDEQIEQLNNKINEKFELENKKEDLVVSSNSNLKGRDLIKPYVWPIIISEIIILVYVGIYTWIVSKNLKSIILNILKTIGITILTALIYFSIVAIVRIPVNRLTIPIGIVLYVIESLLTFNYIYKKAKIIKEK